MGGGIQEQKVLNWLLRVYKRLFYGKKNKFDRGLPFADCFVDRWEKAEALGFGKGTSIYDSSLVLGDVKVGENSWIGPNTVLEIAGVQIYSHDSVNWSISGGKEKYEYAKTIIEDNCYIAPNVIIQKGVRIEKGSIIGANSFVNKDIPAGSKAFGTPVNIKKNNS